MRSGALKQGRTFSLGNDTLLGKNKEIIVVGLDSIKGRLPTFSAGLVQGPSSTFKGDYQMGEFSKRGF